jgi:hypothetical protein
MDDDRYRDGRANGFFFGPSRDVNWGSNYAEHNDPYRDTPEPRESSQLKIVPAKKNKKYKKRVEKEIKQLNEFNPPTRKSTKSKPKTRKCKCKKGDK